VPLLPLEPECAQIAARVGEKADKQRALGTAAVSEEVVAAIFRTLMSGESIA
jgi:hypothetical protein